jgi:hypothetical protein
MRRAFGRGDWVANDVLFAAYHVHVPWMMPATVLIDTFDYLGQHALDRGYGMVAVCREQSVGKLASFKDRNVERAGHCCILGSCVGSAYMGGQP